MGFSKAEVRRLEAMSVAERRLKTKGYKWIAGVDEAGRGPLAGPVVAAACILPENVLFEHLNDSKQLAASQRHRLFEQILETPSLLYGIGIVDVATIDRINILQATFLAMQQAVEALSLQPDYLLVDGNRLPKIAIPGEAIIAGDANSISIAAASIIAKVTRDRLMEELDGQWPHYGFKKHKGYGTQKHLEALQKFGPCPHHRTSFAPVKSLDR